VLAYAPDVSATITAGKARITGKGCDLDVPLPWTPESSTAPGASVSFLGRAHAMKLSDHDERLFHDGGFVVLSGLFTDAEVASVRAALERLYVTAQTLRATGDHDGAFFALSPPPAAGGAVVVQRVVWAGGAEPVLLRTSADRRLLAPALSLLGTPRCEQLLCQAHYKMPNDGVAFEWHQDIQHRDKGGDTWRDVTGRGSFVQTILLVDDMTEENGPLEFLPRDAALLDASGRLVKRDGKAVVDATRAVSVTGRAGDVLLFGPYAVHGSTPNMSAKPRRVLINGYAAPGANKRVYPGRGACRVLPAEDAPAAEESATRLVATVPASRSA
jgi:ectoine hydroxylase